MARSSPNDRIGRLFRHPSGQDELFDKSYEEVLDARRGEPAILLAGPIRTGRKLRPPSPSATRAYLDRNSVNRVYSTS